MARAVRCPVCGGSGKVSIGNPYSKKESKTCHGCNGRGWVEVSDR